MIKWCVFEQLEIESKKVLMETLQGKVTELQEVTKNQQSDIELQVKAVQGSTKNHRFLLDS